MERQFRSRSGHLPALAPRKTFHLLFRSVVAVRSNTDLATARCAGTASMEDHWRGNARRDAFQVAAGGLFHVWFAVGLAFPAVIVPPQVEVD